MHSSNSYEKRTLNLLKDILKNKKSYQNISHTLLHLDSNASHILKICFKCDV